MILILLILDSHFVDSSGSAAEYSDEGYSLFSIKAGESKVVQANIKNIPKKKGKYKVKFNICNNKGTVLPTSSGGLQLEREFEVDDDDGNPNNFMSISALQLDVLKIEACTDEGGCTVASGPMQLDLLELADGRVDFANKVLLPDNTKDLRLVLSENNTITAEGISSALTVPSGSTSGLKLKGQQVFSEKGGFLTGITLDFDLERDLVVQENKSNSNGKGKGKKASLDDDVVYSFKLKPVITLGTVQVEALPENMAAVVALPDEDVKFALDDDSFILIPAGAVDKPTVITSVPRDFVIELTDPTTGDTSEIPPLSPIYNLSPSGLSFDKPLDVQLHYDEKAIAWGITENNLVIYHNGDPITTSTVNKDKEIVTAQIFHFSTLSIDDYLEKECKKQDPIVGLDGKAIAGLTHLRCPDKPVFDPGDPNDPDDDDDLNGDNLPNFHLVEGDRKSLAGRYRMDVMSIDAEKEGQETHTVSELAKSHNAVVAINGNHFSCLTSDQFGGTCYGGGSGNPVRIHIEDGEVKGKNGGENVVFAFGGSSTDLIPIERLKTSGVIEEGNNDRVFEDVFLDEFNYEIYEPDKITWEEAVRRTENNEATKIKVENGVLHSAIGEGTTLLYTLNSKTTCKPILDEDGDVEEDVVPLPEEDPWPAFGYGKDKVVFLASDRKKIVSDWDHYAQLCLVLRKKHAENAMLLDGGGSTQLAVRHTGSFVITANANYPLRRVVNAIGLVPVGGRFISPNDGFSYDGDELPIQVELDNPETFTSVIIEFSPKNADGYSDFIVCESGERCTEINNVLKPYPSPTTEPGEYILKLKGKKENEEYRLLDEVSVKLFDLNSIGDSIIIEENEASCVLALPDYWFAQAVGHDGESRWTSNNDTDRGVDNYCTYQFSGLNPGKWKVEAYIPSSHATTRKACYELGDGYSTYGAEVDQSGNSDWVTLGVYEIMGGFFDVSLTDMTSEPYTWYSVGFDAIRLTPAPEQPLRGPEKTCVPRLSSGGNSDVSVFPPDAVLGESTVFTVTGHNLSSNLVLSIDDCQNMLALGGTPAIATAAASMDFAAMDIAAADSDSTVTSLQFSCTPSSVAGAGVKAGSVKDTQNNILYNFNVDFKDTEVTKDSEVTSVSPQPVTLNESTTFTVTGSNLPSTLAFFIEECEGVTPLGGSSTSMQFSCTPSWTVGIKNGVVKDETGGNILYEFTVDVSDDAPEESFTCTSGDQTVTWKGREWQRCDDGTTYLWEEAKDYCENLVLGGYSDWRLPTKDELKSLVVCTNGTPTPLADSPDEPYGCGNNNGGNDGSYDVPTIDPSFKCQPEFYWSSTPKEVTDTSPLASKELAWGVYFYYGYAAGKNPNTVHTYVRCIR